MAKRAMPAPRVPPAIEFIPNGPRARPQACKLINAVLLEIAAAQNPDVVKSPGIRTIHAGGAIRGGKTISALAAAALLAKAFPRSRWHVVRASFPDIRRTVLPSLDKVLANTVLRWRRSADDYYAEMRNGSRLYMFAENFSRDKDLNRWKGLETNGFVLEQIEELQEATYDKALERSGSWYDVDGPMPPPMILSTFNPTFNWVKEKVFDVWEAGKAGTGPGLPPDTIFIPMLPDDNPSVTAEQRKQWAKLPPDVYERFILGKWEIEVKGAFLNQFNEEKHTARGLRYNPEHDLWISFDFNVDPMCAIVFQTDGETFFHVLKEYRIDEAQAKRIAEEEGEAADGADVFALCKMIRDDWFHLRPILRVTGDATGDNRMAGVRGAVSQYRIICELWDLDIDEDLFIPGKNPFIGDSRIYCNAVVRHLKGFRIDKDKCPWLIKDCRFYQVGKDREGKVAKLTTGVNLYTNMENQDMGHLLDTLRYGLHIAVPDFLPAELLASMHS